jgi:hypothetical protein
MIGNNVRSFVIDASWGTVQISGEFYKKTRHPQLICERDTREQGQRVFGIVLWACSLISLSCEHGPGVSTIQSAYELEAASGSSLHDSGLKVLEAKCHDSAGKRAGEKYLCEVKFISTGDPTERLYFDIVAVSRNGSNWELKSGLCKR